MCEFDVNLFSEIDSAFYKRNMPEKAVPDVSPTSVELDDAIWFQGRPNDEITFSDWEAHWDAMAFFTPEAFIYYLPSLMKACLVKPMDYLLAMDYVFSCLDRVPEMDHVDDFVRDRFFALSRLELEAVSTWIVTLLSSESAYDKISLERSLAFVGWVGSMKR